MLTVKDDMNDRSMTSVLLLRGVNVGGKNKIGMADLRESLTKAGFLDVVTLGVAGTVVLDTTLDDKALAGSVEKMLPAQFTLDREIVMAVAFNRISFGEIVAGAPEAFGADDARYRYYVLFLKDVTVAEAMKDIEVRPNVDMAWPGPSAVYFRLPSLTSPDRNKSWLNRLIEKPLYQSVTIRNWSTTQKVDALLQKRAST